MTTPTNPRRKVCSYFYHPAGCKKGQQCEFLHVQTCPYGTSCYHGNQCWWPHVPESELKPCGNKECPRKSTADRLVCKPCYVKRFASEHHPQSATQSTIKKSEPEAKPKSEKKNKKTRCETPKCKEMTDQRFCQTCFLKMKQDRKLAQPFMARRCTHCRHYIKPYESCPCQSSVESSEQTVQDNNGLGDFPPLKGVSTFASSILPQSSWGKKCNVGEKSNVSDPPHENNPPTTTTTTTITPPQVFEEFVSASIPIPTFDESSMPSLTSEKCSSTEENKKTDEKKEKDDVAINAAVEVVPDCNTACPNIPSPPTLPMYAGTEVTPTVENDPWESFPPRTAHPFPPNESDRVDDVRSRSNLNPNLPLPYHSRGYRGRGGRRSEFSDPPRSSLPPPHVFPLLPVAPVYPQPPHANTNIYQSTPLMFAVTTQQLMDGQFYEYDLGNGKRLVMRIEDKEN